MVVAKKTEELKSQEENMNMMVQSVKIAVMIELMIVRVHVTGTV